MDTGDDMKVPTQTVAKFLFDHRAVLDSQAPAADRAAAIAALRGTVVVVDEASMLSTADARRLVAIANATEVGRLVLIGDAKQLGAVEAGKPFAQMQDANTARMRENLRARSDLVKKVHGLAQGHDMFGLAREMEGHTTTTERTAREAAERWMALGPEERANTMLFVTGRALRSAVNEALQSMREKAGETARGLTVRGVLSEVHLTREEQRHPQSYRAGQVVLLLRPLTSQGLAAGRMTILSQGEKGALQVRHEDGREALFRPGRLAANRVPGAVRMFEERDLKVNIGDPIVWRTNDPGRGIYNNERAVLAGVDGANAQFIKADGQLLDMPKTDPMLSRIDLGYAMNAHAAQGATADRAIVVVRSDEGKLITPPLLAVLFTRARDEISLITDSLDKLAGRASRNPGEKTSALEVARSDTMPRQMDLALPDPKAEVERETVSKAQAAKAALPSPERTRDLSRGM